MIPWLALVLAVIAAVALIYWLLVTTEGVFLGRRVVVWLYDVTATRYDAIKQYNPVEEQVLVVRPIIQALGARRQPRLLDVATGTGRVPLAMVEALDEGTVVGLDDSARMLAIAAEKLAAHDERVTLVRHPAVPLPFAANSFDVVTCLEALEFFPSDEAALREMVRVLRPGGALITTRRSGWEGRLFLTRYRSEPALRALLGALGLDDVRTYLWEVNYDLVTARKPLG
ncbi:MAG: class I SAM-dependent methyltransferase [Anaerolineae bacterium]|nr:class I SAM-dependent methyltransferase [Anaerolineae bacterium]